MTAPFLAAAAQVAPAFLDLEASLDIARKAFGRPFNTTIVGPTIFGS